MIKIRNLIRSINKNSGDSDEKHMKIRFNLDEEFIFLENKNSIHKFP